MTNLIYNLLYTFQGVLVKTVPDYVSVKGYTVFLGGFLRRRSNLHLKVGAFCAIFDARPMGYCTVHKNIVFFIVVKQEKTHFSIFFFECVFERPFPNPSVM